MLTLKWISRFIIAWILSSFVATNIAFIKDALDHKYKISSSWYYVQSYKWIDLAIIYSIFLLFVSISYFLIILIFKNQFNTISKKIILAFFLSFFIVPLFFPYTPFPDYLFKMGVLKSYLFGVFEIGIAGTLIPLIDYLIVKWFVSKSSI